MISNEAPTLRERLRIHQLERLKRISFYYSDHNSMTPEKIYRLAVLLLRTQRFISC